MVVVVVGNIFVIEVVRRNNRLRTIPNICITSLAIADLFVGLINIPLYIYAIYHQTEITITYNKVQNSFDIYFGVTSILHLTFISMERCYAITFPMKRRFLQKGMHEIFKYEIFIYFTVLLFTDSLRERNLNLMIKWRTKTWLIKIRYCQSKII